MKRLFLTVLILSLVIPTLEPVYYIYRQIAYAADEAEPIECNGDNVEYFEKEKKIVGSGNVVIKYKGKELTCDKVTVWTETKYAEAEGNVKIKEGENVFEGEKAVYNFEDSTGNVTNFKGYAPPWYVVGKEGRRISEKEFMVKKAYITTCDHNPPHWKLTADKVSVYPNIMLTTYNAMVWFNPLSIRSYIPAMWVPYYCHPLDDNRPHVTVIPGKSKDWGLYLLTAWRYNLTPNQKGYIHFDYRERKDVASGVDYIYDTKILGKGAIKSYYMHERDLKWKHQYTRWAAQLNNDYDEKNPGATTELEKGLLRIRHQWQANPDTLITAEMHKYRDENLLKDYFFNEYEKDEHPESYILLSNNNFIGNFTLLTKKRANRFDDTTELLPEAKLNVSSRRIGESRFYYSGEAGAVNFHQVSPRYTDANPGTIPDPLDNTRFDTYNKLSYESKLGFLSVTPNVSTRQTYYKREAENDNSRIRGIFSSGVDVSTKFFKVFHTQASPLGMEINDLRHIITPTVSYGHTAPPTMPSDKITQFDGIDSLGRSNAATFSLENKLQTKRGKAMGNADLAMLLVTTGYDFNHTPGGQLSNYTTQLELRPYDWLIATSNAILDPHTRYHHQWLNQLDNDVSLSFGKKGSLGLGHKYFSGSNNLTLHTALNIVPGWSFSAYEDFSLLGTFHGEKKKRDLREQEYTIVKSLHCWDMKVRYNVARDKGEEIMFIFTLKAFPDIPFEFGRNYHAPKAGSQSYDSSY